MTRKSLILIAAALFAALPVTVSAAEKTAAELEKEKALASPYPNDYGPAEIDEQVKDYPAEKLAGYKLLKSRCAQCHQPSRPLNSRFVEVEGKTDAEREANLAKLKKDQPDLFTDDSVWQVETKIWNRYVKRMMNKPGCGVKFGGKMTDAEAKKIWEFLAYDGRRKIGENAAKWKEHRKKLVAELKAKNPKRYEELAKDKDL